MVQSMPLHPKPRHLLPHSNPEYGFTNLVPAYPGCPGKEAVERVQCSRSSFSV